MPIAGRRVVIALAAMGTAAAVLTGCDSAPAGPVGANPRQVTVVGSGEVKGVPDTLTADVSVEAGAADVTTAMNQANDRQNSVLNALNASGIDAKDIGTTQVSLQPQYTDNSVITGYRASNSIQIKIRKLDTASQVLANVVSAGGDATRINSVSYSVEDDSKLVTDARARAFNDAKQRAAAVCRTVRAVAGQGHLDLGGARWLHTAAPADADAARRDGQFRSAVARAADGGLLGDGGLGARLIRRCLGLGKALEVLRRVLPGLDKHHPVA